jgi:hypothetical protein
MRGRSQRQGRALRDAVCCKVPKLAKAQLDPEQDSPLPARVDGADAAAALQAHLGHLTALARER